MIIKHLFTNRDTLVTLKNVTVTGINLVYPNVLLRRNDELYLPTNDTVCSLNKKTIYEESGMIYEESGESEESCDKKTTEQDVFFFVYNTENYYHFVYDSLPALSKWIELKKTIPSLKLLVGKYTCRFVTEFLELAGVCTSDIVEINTSTIYNNMYVFSSYSNGNSPPQKEIYWFYDYLRNRTLITRNTPKKIYVSRRSHIHGDLTNIGTDYTQRRKMQCEDMLVEYLQKEGYVEVFPELLSIRDKISLFYNATHIVGAIGGGLANVVFSKPTTKLIAIVSPDFLTINSRFKYCFANINVYYYTNTWHIETTLFKLYQRVSMNNAIGEICEHLNDHKALVAFGDNTQVGWNRSVQYVIQPVPYSSMTPIDNGLNSPWSLDINTFINDLRKNSVLYIAHRINTIEDLNNTKNSKNAKNIYGVELDLRDYGNDIIISHDPYVINAVKFYNYMKHYPYDFIILNIKSEGIEYAVLDILQEYPHIQGVFLDSSFPMIIKMLKNNIVTHMCRLSEFESIETVLSVCDKYPSLWGVWVDCFTKFPLSYEQYMLLKNRNLKLCYVSPELQGLDTETTEAYKEKIEKIEKIENNMYPDMVCTKVWNIPV